MQNLCFDYQQREGERKRKREKLKIRGKEEEKEPKLMFKEILDKKNFNSEEDVNI